MSRTIKKMSNVTNRDLVALISDKTGLTQVDTAIIVEAFFDAVGKSLRSGNNIEIRGFGRFLIGYSLSFLK
ncbi:MAG: hypothetical protein GF401_04110 [Chitinivibrionales bacterium]|nr:hypothetical protein [Chitinivibrionales bacterium]